MQKTTFNQGMLREWLPPKLILIMKMIVIIMTACLMQVSAASVAQKLTYSKKGATLKQIFTEIRKQTGYFVVYSDANVNAQARMDVNFVNTKLESVLNVLGNSQNLSYEIDEKNITIKPKEKSYLETVIDRFQAIDTRGRVVDSLGNGLPGATVSVKGTNKSTQTNQNGEFYLKGVDEGAVFVVTYLGYVTKEQQVYNDFNFIRMVESTSKLDEVQIQAYGITTRRLNTGNISTIKARDMESNVGSDPMLALKGRIPGMSVVQTTGVPGGQVKINIRGVKSFAYGTDPLVLVDGIPFDQTANNIYIPKGAPGVLYSAFNFINPDDIESIDVLKVPVLVSCFETGQGGEGGPCAGYLFRPSRPPGALRDY